MKNKTLLLAGIIFVMVYSTNLLASGNAISIDEVMRLAEKNSPRLTAARFHEIAAKKSIDVAKANYFPTLNAEAIDSTGFPGSSGAIGVNGLMGSPYRSGFSIGLVAEQTIFDFGRTYYAVEASRHQAEFSKQETRVTLYQVKQLALETYYECAYFRTQKDIWNELVEYSALITKEAQHFVDTGQVSIVDRYLSKAQTEEARTAHAFFAERLQKSKQELAVIMGITQTNFSCPPLPNHLTHSLNPNLSMDRSPLLARAMMDKQVAQSRFLQEKAGYYPKIVAIASLGSLQSTHLEPKKDYAAGIGIILPIIDMRTSGEVQVASANLYAKNHEVEAEKQYLGEMNAKYDAIIQSSKVRLRHLDGELTLANKAFKTAKERYFSLEGQLIDLREAFRNLARVQTEIQETRLRFLQASGSKALLNGSGE